MQTFIRGYICINQGMAVAHMAAGWKLHALDEDPLHPRRSAPLALALRGSRDHVASLNAEFGAATIVGILMVING